MPFLAFLFVTQTGSPAHKAPTYVGKSQAVIAAMETALSTLDKRVMTIKSDEGITTVELLGKKVREDQPTLLWAFDGKTIYVRDRAKHVFVSGPIRRHRAVEVVSTVTGRRVDVVTRALLFRRVPLEEAFVDATVRLDGFVAPNGVPCDIVRADTPSLHTTIFLRKSDHLPQSVTSESLVGGKIVSTFSKSFSYGPLKHSRFSFAKQPYEKTGHFPVLKVEKL